MTAMNNHRTQYHSPFTEVPLHGIEAHDLKFANAKPVRQFGRGRRLHWNSKRWGFHGTYPIPIPSMAYLPTFGCFLKVKYGKCR